MKHESVVGKTGSLAFSAAVIAAIFLVIGLFLHGMVWASDKALPWLIGAGQASFAICAFVFLPLCIFGKTRPWAGFGFFMASYILGAELFAYCCVVAFAIWGYVGLILGVMLGGIGVIPIALLAAAFAAIRHRTEWGLFGDILLGIFLTFGTRLLGIHLSTSSPRQRLGSATARPAMPELHH